MLLFSWAFLLVAQGSNFWRTLIITIARSCRPSTENRGKNVLLENYNHYKENQLWVE